MVDLSTLEDVRHMSGSQQTVAMIMILAIFDVEQGSDSSI
tara:strand:+ start:294 stop:413 length:120 start_codon:yes stop_codon:yes gene_type:complete